MNFLAVLEDGTYHYLSIVVIGLYILGTLKTNGLIIFFLFQRLFLDVFIPICIVLFNILRVVSFWSLNFLSTLFQCCQRLNPQLVRQLRYGLITTLGCWAQKAFSNLAVFYGKNINARKSDPNGYQNQASVSSKVTKVIFGWLFYCLNQFWEKIWQAALSMKYFKLSKSWWHFSSSKKPCASVLSKPQQPIEPEIPTDNPTYPKKDSLKFQLGPLPGQVYEFDQET